MLEKAARTCSSGISPQCSFRTRFGCRAHAADQALYGADLNREDILNGKVAVPEAAQQLVAEIRRYTGSEKTAQKTTGE